MQHIRNITTLRRSRTPVSSPPSRISRLPGPHSMRSLAPSSYHHDGNTACRPDSSPNRRDERGETGNGRSIACTKIVAAVDRGRYLTALSLCGWRILMAFFDSMEGSGCRWIITVQGRPHPMWHIDRNATTKEPQGTVEGSACKLYPHRLTL
ncbi:hypothetical protein P154DRAFT_521759 [Amniculicola lignicola CBS 123094]|uniref:Uncharacterized protein n=1 Tax=Amniculicola lignicola CBS 123094 TaxID=1392246 RepID=A0A6A5WI63_9PLEO|nr:hypothetical protein P154DRAFT_521759 [Amniculicola lignicola CBS 123094]